MPVTFGKKTLIKFVGGQMLATQGGRSTAEFQKEIAQVGQRARDLTVPLRQFIPIWFRQEKQVFAAQGIPRWPQLSPAYESWKNRVAPGRPILQLSGDLYRSLTSMTSQTIAEAHPRSLRLGTRNPRSAVHQQGWNKIPARPHVVILPETFRIASQMCLDYILAGKGQRRRR